MGSIIRRRARRLGLALAAGSMAWLVSAAPGRAGDGPPGPATGPPICPTCRKPCTGPHTHSAPGSGLLSPGGPRSGTLGYGAPGVYPGFQGFGLGYHKGYGYGGDALGVGAEGGYPFYGGPGYPHPWPTLRRLGGISPFPFYGGPGGPSPDHPNYFGPVGPLAPDVPVVKVENEPGTTVGTYGCFHGTIPYPETTFAPYTTIAATSGTSSGVSSDSPPNTGPNMTPAPGEMPFGLSAGRSLGIDAEPVIEVGDVPGLKVVRITPGGVAEKAGLRVGDVIRSVNGYITAQPGNFTWIITNAAPDNVLRMSVHSASDGQVNNITVRRP